LNNHFYFFVDETFILFYNLHCANKIYSAMNDEIAYGKQVVSLEAEVRLFFTAR